MSGKERYVLKLKDYIGVSNYGTLCGLADAQGDSEFISETILFQRLDLMERRGSGFKKILDAYAFESEKRGETITPRFESTSTDFFLVLPNLNYDKVINGVASSSEGQDAEAAIGAGGEKSKEKSREKSREKILAYLSVNPDATTDGLVEITGLSISGVEKNIRELKASGRLKRVGTDKGGHWEVVAKDGE